MTDEQYTTLYDMLEKVLDQLDKARRDIQQVKTSQRASQKRERQTMTEASKEGL